jgi:class 3 adenylate cyclase/tetratricopeptide (TPR) repeat protein
MDVEEWLRSLGLGRYEQAFRDNEIDEQILPSLTGEDLKEIGVGPVGHRRKLLEAIAALPAGKPSLSLQRSAQEAASNTPKGAERRQLTIMFCDLVGSTALAARLDPEDLREVVGAYHRVVADTVAAAGGFVAKYMGDGVLVYFGYPQAHEHDAEQAVRAGLALVDRIGRLETRAGTLSGRVGIATGVVVVGDLLGSGDSQERGVVGETPNLAARLQGMGGSGVVLIADSTRRLVGDLFEYRNLGFVDIKGLAEPVPAWQVLRERTIENRFEALRSAALSPLVGRDEELGLLMRRWERAREGDGQIVLISGEAGIGKSRMTVALQEEMAAEHGIRLRYFCSPHHRDSALYPFVARIERTAGFTEEDTAAAKRDKLIALLSRSGDTPLETVAAFADLLGLPTEGCDPPQPNAPRQRRELILGALVAQVERLARRQPVLFLFEDAHWADSTSLELLERIAEHVRRLPVLLIVTHRPDFEPPWTGEPQVTSLTLSRLGRRESAALTERVAGDKKLPTEILDRVVEHTDGIPLFIEELTKTLLEGGVLKEGDGRYLHGDAMPTLAIPSSLQDSLMARLDHLAPGKEVAQIGAAIGREFSYAVLEAVAGRPPDQLREALDQLWRGGLIFRRGTLPNGAFVFKHAFVQDAAYGTLLRGQRQELHTAIATFMDRYNSLSAGENAALLAHHWIGAEDWEKALHYTLKAADRARALYARTEAVNHYWQALGLFERLPENSDRNRVHARVLLSAMWLPGFVRDDGARARMLQHLDRALENAVNDGDATAAVELKVLKGAFLDDETLLVSALAEAEALGDVSALASAEHRYGHYLGIHGQYEKSLVHVARSIELMGAQGNDSEGVVIWMSAGGRCYSARAGRLDEALAYADRVQEGCSAIDSARLRAWIAMNAEPHLYRGDWEAVVRVAANALPTAWEIREWVVVVFASAWLTIAYLKLGRTTDAKQVLDRVFKEVPLRTFSASTMHAVAFINVALAQLHLADGRLGQALSAAGTALRVAERYQVHLEQGAAHRVLGEVYEAMGNRDRADGAFRRSLDVLEAIQSRPELAQTLLAYGRFRLGSNRQDDRTLVQRALRLFKEINAPGWIEEARAALTAT